MALFTSKVDYALRALLDLAVQPVGRPSQSREIAGRQDIPESYLNQLLVVLRRAGLVRSVRGASGGYVLGREPRLITAADVILALHGQGFLGDLPAEGTTLPAAWVIRNLHSHLNGTVRQELARISLADLVTEAQKLDEAQSLMLGL
ncbi:MAG: transcriptional regulator, BadM/Rrf2 family [Armatimonadetes bacterium]|jgi:Rrf2 family protein|nr:transcriptional regulator, BadM/Rrf2 family [Armatimonadota bacterium]